MRNPLRNLVARQTDQPTLRERFKATREKYARTLRAHRALNAPEPEALPAGDRAALVNYATFLAWERNRVCAELYPHLGTRAASFVLGMNAAHRFFHPDDDHRARHKVPPASTRAAKVLDLVGIDWRSDLPGDGIERAMGSSGPYIDNGERPAVPHGWPDLDAALVTAAGDLVKIEAAINLLLNGESRDADQVPGYSALEDERSEVLDTLVMEKARTLRGLQAKARTLSSREAAIDASWAADLGLSLARDIISADNRAVEPRPDPIFALIETARRLEAKWSRLFAISANKPDDHPDSDETAEAHDAMWEHVRGVLLKTVPQTAAHGTGRRAPSAGTESASAAVGARADRAGCDSAGRTPRGSPGCCLPCHGSGARWRALPASCARSRAHCRCPPRGRRLRRFRRARRPTPRPTNDHRRGGPPCGRAGARILRTAPWRGRSGSPPRAAASRSGKRSGARAGSAWQGIAGQWLRFCVGDRRHLVIRSDARRNRRLHAGTGGAG